MNVLENRMHLSTVQCRGIIARDVRCSTLPYELGDLPTLPTLKRVPLGGINVLILVAVSLDCVRC